MNAIKKRPFAFSCCTFIFFSYVFYLCPQNIKIITFLLMLALGTTLLFFSKKSKYFSFYLVLPILISSVVSLTYFNLHYDKITAYAGKSADIQFVILEEKYTSESFSTYTVKIERINGEKSDIKATLSASCNFSKELFSVHSCKATFNLPKESQNGFSARKYNLSKGIFISAEADGDITPLDETRKIFPLYYLDKTSDFFSSMIDKYISADNSALSKALILGDKTELNPKDTRNFRLLGMSHILAVSGMHLTILIGSFDFLLSKLKLSKNKRCILIIIVTLFYAGITGFSPSVKRAAIMLILSSLSFLLSKNNDSLTALCFSGAILCFIEPHALFDIGLQLSFLSTMGIIVFASPLSEKIKQKAKDSKSKALKLSCKLFSALLFGIAPIMFSLPIIWLSFGEISLISPISNIIFTPLITIIMYSCPIMFITSFIPPIVGVISLIPAYFSALVLNLAGKLANVSPVLSINYDFTKYIVAFLVVSLVIILLIDFKNKFVFLIPFVICIFSFAICINAYNQSNSDKIKSIYTNNNYGDSFLVIDQGSALLCDISGCSYQTAKECEYYLGENHITRLDCYLVTDYNGRGIETIEKLSCLTRVDNLILPTPKTHDETLIANGFIEYADSNDINCVFYKYEDNDQISFGRITLDVKKLANAQINSPASISVTISTDSQTLSYIGQSCYSTSLGKYHFSTLFGSSDSIMFGKYGKENQNDEIMSLFYHPEIKLYFTTDKLYKSYSKHLSPNADIHITGSYYEFDLS